MMKAMTHTDEESRAFPLAKLELVGAQFAADQLGMARRAADTLIHSEFAELLPNSPKPSAHINHLGRPVLRREALEALKEVPFAAYDPDAVSIVNVRVREARRVDDSDRTYKGWHPRLTEGEADLATSRWWPIPRHDVLGHSFLVSISGFVTRCGKIEDTDVDRGRIAYTVDWDIPDITQTFLHKRIETPPGGTAVYLRPSR